MRRGMSLAAAGIGIEIGGGGKRRMTGGPLKARVNVTTSVD